MIIFKNCLEEFAAEKYPGAFFAMANADGFDRHGYWEELRKKEVDALVSKDGLRSYYNAHDFLRPYFLTRLFPVIEESSPVTLA